MLKVDSASCIIEGALPCVIHTFSLYGVTIA